MASLHIREFGAVDLCAANALTNWFITHTPIHFGMEASSDAAFAAVWQQGIAAGYPWLAAEVEGAFAGYCKAGPWRERAAYHRTVEAGIYVTPEARGRGVGTALYQALFAALRARGFRVVVAGITLPNAPSVRLHEAVGFAPVGVFHAVGQKFGAWHDVGFWERDLEAPGLP